MFPDKKNGIDMFTSVPTINRF